MKVRILGLLGALGVLCGGAADPVCVHSGRGASSRISLDRVRKARDEVKETLRRAILEGARKPPEGPYDSGLPACRTRGRRTVRGELPAALVGKTIAFGPAERMPRADYRVATSARRLAIVEADALADPALVARLGVRCVPSLVRIVTEAELELVENP